MSKDLNCCKGCGDLLLFNDPDTPHHCSTCILKITEDKAIFKGIEDRIHNEKIEVAYGLPKLEGEEPKNKNLSKCRIDTAKGAEKYFKERFKTFSKKDDNE